MTPKQQKFVNKLKVLLLTNDIDPDEFAKLPEFPSLAICVCIGAITFEQFVTAAKQLSKLHPNIRNI